jgi:hypothetical protein
VFAFDVCSLAYDVIYFVKAGCGDDCIIFIAVMQGGKIAKAFQNSELKCTRQGQIACNMG